MASKQQFTAKSLSRLLSNVEREVLIDAIELADLTHVLYPRHLQVIDDLEENWNTLFNVWLGGLVAEAATAVKAAYDPSNPRGSSAGDLFRPTGVLFVDAALASILQAVDFFSPDGFLAEILRTVWRLEDVVHPEHPPHPEEPIAQAPQQAPLVEILFAATSADRFLLEGFDFLVKAFNSIKPIWVARPDSAMGKAAKRGMNQMEKVGRKMSRVSGFHADIINLVTFGERAPAPALTATQVEDAL